MRALCCAAFKTDVRANMRSHRLFRRCFDSGWFIGHYRGNARRTAGEAQPPYPALSKVARVTLTLQPCQGHA